MFPVHLSHVQALSWDPPPHHSSLPCWDPSEFSFTGLFKLRNLFLPGTAVLPPSWNIPSLPIPQERWIPPGSIQKDFPTMPSILSLCFSISNRIFGKNWDASEWDGLIKSGKKNLSPKKFPNILFDSLEIKHKHVFLPSHLPFFCQLLPTYFILLLSSSCIFPALFLLGFFNPSLENSG